MNGEGRYMLVVMIIILVYFTGGCGGGSGGDGGFDMLPAADLDCFDASGMCCFDGEYKVHNGIQTICVEPDTRVVWDGFALYLEDM